MALLRNVASAGRQCSTLQVVRISCLVPHESSVMQLAFTASFQHTAPSPEKSAATRTRRVGREDKQLWCSSDDISWTDVV